MAAKKKVICGVDGCTIYDYPQKVGIHRRKAHGIESPFSKRRKERKNRAKEKKVESGHVPVQVNFCMNCGHPIPKEIIV